MCDDDRQLRASLNIHSSGLVMAEMGPFDFKKKEFARFVYSWTDLEKKVYENGNKWIM